MPEEQKIEKTEEIPRKEELKLEEISREPAGPLEREVRLEDIEGLHKAMTTVPTHVPKHFSEQEIHYLSGGVYRLYQYISDAWKKIYDSSVIAKAYVELAVISVSKTQSVADDWEDWDLSGSIPTNATEAEIVVRVDAGETGGVRKNGSAISNRYLAGITATYTVLLDANRIVETYHSNNSATRFYVAGYWI